MVHGKYLTRLNMYLTRREWLPLVASLHILCTYLGMLARYLGYAEYNRGLIHDHDSSSLEASDDVEFRVLFFLIRLRAKKDIELDRSRGQRYRWSTGVNEPLASPRLLKYTGNRQ